MEHEKLDALIADAVDPLFADRFIEAVAKSLKSIHPTEQRDWLSLFLRGVRDRIEQAVQTGSMVEFVARRHSPLPEDSPDYLDYLDRQAEEHFAEVAN